MRYLVKTTIPLEIEARFDTVEYSNTTMNAIIDAAHAAIDRAFEVVKKPIAFNKNNQAIYQGTHNGNMMIIAKDEPGALEKARGAGLS